MTASTEESAQPSAAAKQRILVVEDDPTVSEVIGRYLATTEFEVTYAYDGLTGLRMAEASPPALLVLDLMLPGMSGLEVCQRLRARSDIPIVMLTALGEDEDRIAGLEMGADDYVTKPFSPRELVLRIMSVLRRAAPSTPDDRVVSRAGLRVDLGTRQAWRDDTLLSLTLREFDLLAFFLIHPHETFSREQLLSLVWGWQFGDQSTVTVHVRRLREKIEVDPSEPLLIATVWGVGYRWDGT